MCQHHLLQHKVLKPKRLIYSPGSVSLGALQMTGAYCTNTISVCRVCVLDISSNHGLQRLHHWIIIRHVTAELMPSLVCSLLSYLHFNSQFCQLPQSMVSVMTPFQQVSLKQSLLTTGLYLHATAVILTHSPDKQTTHAHRYKGSRTNVMGCTESI